MQFVIPSSWKWVLHYLVVIWLLQLEWEVQWPLRQWLWLSAALRFNDVYISSCKHSESCFELCLPGCLVSFLKLPPRVRWCLLICYIRSSLPWCLGCVTSVCQQPGQGSCWNTLVWSDFLFMLSKGQRDAWGSQLKSRCVMYMWKPVLMFSYTGF